MGPMTTDPALLFRKAADASGQPPEDLSPELEALWWTRKGEWHKAHDIASTLSHKLGSWIHAHLHVIEGDLGNAAYWYARAGRPAPPQPHDLDAEWLQLVRAAGEP